MACKVNGNISFPYHVLAAREVTSHRKSCHMERVFKETLAGAVITNSHALVDMYEQRKNISAWLVANAS